MHKQTLVEFKIWIWKANYLHDPRSPFFSCIHHMLYTDCFFHLYSSTVYLAALWAQKCQTSAPVGLWIMPVLYWTRRSTETLALQPVTAPLRLNSILILMETNLLVRPSRQTWAILSSAICLHDGSSYRLDYSSIALWTLSEGKPTAAGERTDRRIESYISTQPRHLHGGKKTTSSSGATPEKRKLRTGKLYNKCAKLISTFLQVILLMQAEVWARTHTLANLTEMLLALGKHAEIQQMWHLFLKTHKSLGPTVDLFC